MEKPQDNRWKKGQSGNPNGRAAGSRNRATLDRGVAWGRGGGSYPEGHRTLPVVAQHDLANMSGIDVAIFIAVA
jgi:Family of unknown function (DUF5681)